MVEGANLNQKLSFRLESVGRRIVLNSHAREGGPIFLTEGGRVGELRRTVNPFPLDEWVRIPPLRFAPKREALVVIKDIKYCCLRAAII